MILIWFHKKFDLRQLQELIYFRAGGRATRAKFRKNKQTNWAKYLATKINILPTLPYPQVSILTMHFYGNRTNRSSEEMLFTITYTMVTQNVIIISIKHPLRLTYIILSLQKVRDLQS
jgi:hypothetical protein